VHAKLPEIETWPNQYRTGYEIEIVTPEFTSVCPKTGLPDHFQENVVNRVLADVVKAAQPLLATVEGEFTPRGGVYTKITATYTRSRKRAR
jgi:7-cyano-7-deazaguanine reductase